MIREKRAWPSASPWFGLAFSDVQVTTADASSGRLAEAVTEVMRDIDAVDWYWSGGTIWFAHREHAEAFLKARQNNCNICGRLLDVPGDPETHDCGGDCARCMADVGDTDIAAWLATQRAGRIDTSDERVMRARPDGAKDDPAVGLVVHEFRYGDKPGDDIIASMPTAFVTTAEERIGFDFEIAWRIDPKTGKATAPKRKKRAS